MATVTIELPDAAHMDAKDFLTFTAAKLYEAGKLTLGQAAEFAGYTKVNFMDVLGSYGVSIFNYPAEDLDRDVHNAHKHH